MSVVTIEMGPKPSSSALCATMLPSAMIASAVSSLFAGEEALHDLIPAEPFNLHILQRPTGLAVVLLIRNASQRDDVGDCGGFYAKNLCNRLHRDESVRNILRHVAVVQVMRGGWAGTAVHFALGEELMESIPLGVAVIAVIDEQEIVQITTQRLAQCLALRVDRLQVAAYAGSHTLPIEVEIALGIFDTSHVQNCSARMKNQIRVGQAGVHGVGIRDEELREEFIQLANTIVNAIRGNRCDLHRVLHAGHTAGSGPNAAAREDVRRSLTDRNVLVVTTLAQRVQKFQSAEHLAGIQHDDLAGLKVGSDRFRNGCDAKAGDNDHDDFHALNGSLGVGGYHEDGAKPFLFRLFRNHVAFREEIHATGLFDSRQVVFKPLLVIQAYLVSSFSKIGCISTCAIARTQNCNFSHDSSLHF